MYQPELGRFFSQDRFADKFIDQSVYQYALNNPLRYVDINGDSAWQITNTWGKDQINNYRNFSTQRGNEARENGEDYTCEDFVLSVLIDFASQNGLPMAIENGQGTNDAASDDFSSVDEYKASVFRTTGVRDLQRESNTTSAGMSIESMSMVPGDILLNKYGDDGGAYHVQMITGKADKNVEIHQGNLGYGSADPSSMFYSGKPVQRGVWDTSKDSYTRDGNSSIPAYRESMNVEQRSWNFGGFNQGLKRK